MEESVVKSVIAMIRDELKPYGIPLVLHKGKRLVHRIEKFTSVGVFDISTEIPSMSIATGDLPSKWLPILLHEFSHFKQWKAGIHLQYAVEQLSGEVWKKIITGAQVSKADIDHYVSTDIRYELDAERRTARLIRQLNLPSISVDQYIRGANAYLYFYGFIPKCRKWYKSSNPPYFNTELMSVVGGEFLPYKKYLKPPEEVREILYRDYF
jgi:hypothetical protein